MILISFVDNDIQSPAMSMNAVRMPKAIIVSEICGRKLVAYEANHLASTLVETIHARQMSNHDTIPAHFFWNHASMKDAAQPLFG